MIATARNDRMKKARIVELCWIADPGISAQDAADGLADQVRRWLGPLT